MYAVVLAYTSAARGCSSNYLTGQLDFFPALTVCAHVYSVLSIYNVTAVPLAFYICSFRRFQISTPVNLHSLPLGNHFVRDVCFTALLNDIGSDLSVLIGRFVGFAGSRVRLEVG